MKTRFRILICLFATMAAISRGESRPRIWVDDSDRAAVLKKIETQPWAQAIFERMKAAVDPLADQHAKDPAWILGRTQLTWAGPNYTDFKMEGGELVQSGNAAHPTVRFMKGRMPAGATSLFPNATCTGSTGSAAAYTAACAHETV